MHLNRLTENVYELRPQRLGACRVYVVIDGGCWLLIDAGNQRRTPAQVAALRRELGLGPPEVLLITHWHPDHLGGAADLRRAWGVPVALHAADHDCAAGRVRPSLSPIGWAEHHFADNHPRYFEPDLAPADGDEFRVGSLSVRAVHSPGHSPGHTAYYLAERGVLFIGDALGGKGGTILGDPRLFSSTPAASLASLKRLSRLNFEWLAAGHQLHHSPELPALLRRWTARWR
jgi:glyoxylase-like metal-dependent hydrolase (beta-lactamase superfamily II)